MSDVTVEDVRAEMERATQVLDGYGAAVERQWIEPLKLRIMETLAIRTREARREALKEAEDVAWDVAGDEDESGDDDVSLGAEQVAMRLAAIRALMGPET